MKIHRMITPIFLCFAYKNFQGVGPAITMMQKEGEEATTVHYDEKHQYYWLESKDIQTSNSISHQSQTIRDNIQPYIPMSSSCNADLIRATV